MEREINKVFGNYEGCSFFIEALLYDIDTIEIDVVIKKIFHETSLMMIYSVVGKQYFNKMEG